MVLNDSPHSAVIRGKQAQAEAEARKRGEVIPSPTPKAKPISFRDRLLKVEARVLKGELIRRDGKRYVWDADNRAASKALVARLIEFKALRPVAGSGLFDDPKAAQLYEAGVVRVSDAWPLKPVKAKKLKRERLR